MSKIMDRQLCTFLYFLFIFFLGDFCIGSIVELDSFLSTLTRANTHNRLVDGISILFTTTILINFNILLLYIENFLACVKVLVMKGLFFLYNVRKSINLYF